MVHSTIEGHNGNGTILAERIPAWSKLAKFKADPSAPVTLADGLAHAGFDKPVEIQPLRAEITVAGAEYPLVTQTIKGKNVTFRNLGDGRIKPLGIVGDRYATVQDEQAYGFLAEVLGGGGTLDSIGDYNGGAITYVSLRIGEDILINGEDAVGRYAVARNSHDGSTKVSFHVAMHRFACANQITASLKGAKHSYSIRHTGSAEGKINAAREALALTFAYSAEWAETMERLAATELSNENVQEYFNELFPQPAGDAVTRRASTLWESRMDTLWDIYNGPTQTKISGNGYAAFNAVCELLDHRSSTRGKDADNRRAENVLGGSYQSVKDSALRILIPA